jgi:hypothetical protein
LRLRKLKIKWYFILLIFDLKYLLFFYPSEEKIKLWKFKRFKNGKIKPVEKFNEAITFFRDAIAHPEDFKNKSSPSKFTRDKNSWRLDFCYFWKTELNDYLFQIADWQILIKWDIINYLKTIL